ncbi:MAG TPA: dual specificity protein phosphatase [Anaeromyxobacteraceae bacterium]|nr:dual specificity protein phosphatase [Anaeromyxobacteraceae bacterium]
MSREPSFNLDWVTPQLAIGGRLPTEAAAHLAQRLRVSHVVDVRVEECDDEHRFRAHGIGFLHLPTLDTRAVSQSMLDDGVAWVNEHLDRGARVLVHCEHGIGRSVLLVLCVLVSRGEPPLSALERAKTARPVVSPSPEQLGAFAEWVRRWSIRPGRRVEVPDLDALGRIAYRHLTQSA